MVFSFLVCKCHTSHLKLVKSQTIARLKAHIIAIQIFFLNFLWIKSAMDRVHVLKLSWKFEKPSRQKF